MNNSENCRDTTERRRRIRARAAGGNEPNGIDYVEVDEKLPLITVYFLNKAPRHVTPANVLITGGVCIRDIKVTGVKLCIETDLDRDDCMQITVAPRGDFSTYTLHLVEAPGGRRSRTPLASFDPRYARIDFTFRASGPTDLDCAPQATCHTTPPPAPEISYLAKDYSSFRQLIFDRLALIMPDWKERHIPDTGVALVELFAYVGDYLSYYQDAVATEAYLDTARLRVSVRRHAALVDYAMHEGCNARAWVCVKVGQDVTLKPTDIFFITGHNASYGIGGKVLTTDGLRDIPPASYEVFEPLVTREQRQPLTFYAAHNKLRFYTWEDRECCLPRGATTATLRDRWEREPPPPPPPRQQQPAQAASQQARADAPAEQGRAEMSAEGSDTFYVEWPDVPLVRRTRRLQLKVGDVLIFEEVKGPKTGLPADADRAHRHAVRLTKVEPRVDELYDQPVVDIEWAREDALPFPLCISTVGQAPSCPYLKNVSVARGNVVLVDHGRTLPPETLPPPNVLEEPAGCEGPYEPREPSLRTARYRPTLRRGPLTQRAPFPAPASVRAAQAQYLGRFMGAVRQRVEQLRAQTNSGQLLAPAEADELETIFSRKTLAQVELITDSVKGKPPTAAEQTAALDRLLARLEEFLAKKARRLSVLRERVLSGYVLSHAEQEELGELFGARLAGDLQLLAGQMLGPAIVALRQQPREALPCITIRAQRPPPSDAPRPRRYLQNYYPLWLPQRDLLSSTDRQRHFVVEVDNEGRAHLRFGDGELGRAPEPGRPLAATYRVGNGLGGNVGAEAISHIVSRRRGLPPPELLSARNPLPAQGGIDPEPTQDVKMFAPGAARKELRRAITPEDYAGFAERGRPDVVQRAAAQLRWAGSWYEMQTAVDPLGTTELSAELLAEIKGSLYPYRRIGHDLTTRAARFVPLDIALEVCVSPHYLRGHVKAALQDLFSNRVLPNGQLGLFHPDNWSFGQSVYLSHLVAAAQAVEGVESVWVTRMQRLLEAAQREIRRGAPAAEPEEIRQGVLPIGPYEVARLDSDPSFPEHGRLVLDVRGGR
ncbi:MAG: putative baseplate assembly protein [Pyrinomonadaceae bacterium]